MRTWLPVASCQRRNSPRSGGRTQRRGCAPRGPSSGEICVAFSGIAIAFVTTALTRAQFTALQGLRQIRTRGHVIVCGAGNVGTRVIEFLRMLKQPVVV